MQYPLLYNAAAAGVSDGDYRITGGYKDQWRNITTPYRTFIMSGDLSLLREKIGKGFLGTGATIVRDMAGDADFGLTQVHLAVSATKMLSPSQSVSAGLEGGFAQRTLDGAKFQWGSQFDGTKYDNAISSGEPLLSDAFFFSDFSGGVLWNFNNDKNLKINSGFSLHHLNRPKQFFYLGDKKLYSRFTWFTSSSYRISGTSTTLLPSCLVSVQGPAREIIGGLLVQKSLGSQAGESPGGETAIGFGAQYRASDAFILMTRLQLKNIVVGLSYDINVSELSIASKGWGGGEISFTYYHTAKSKESSPQIHKF